MRASPRAAATVLVAAFVLFAASCAPPPSGGSPGLASCPTAGSGEIRVVVVVDLAAFSSGPASTSCVVLPHGSNGIDALSARAQQLGTTMPRIAGSGLLCGIDGEPAAPACGELGPNGYEYWSYWFGGSDWDFATTGPASRVLVDGDVEGWRFVPGGSAQAPRTSSVFAELAS